MKIGDIFPVTIAGQTVANAKVVELDKDSATLIVPATKVVMAIRTEFASPEPVEPNKEVIITGVDRVDSDGNVIESSPDSEIESDHAPAVENTEIAENVQSD